MWPNPQFPADLVTFTEKIHNGKLHFLCSDYCETLRLWPWISLTETPSFVNSRLKKRLQHMHFPVNFVNFLITSYIQIICGWLIPKGIKLFYEQYIRVHEVWIWQYLGFEPNTSVFSLSTGIYSSQACVPTQRSYLLNL